jgi:hypothetical protein
VNRPKMARKPLSKRPRTQINSGPGAPVANQNARKCLPWLSYDLSTADGVERFLEQVIRATWTGELGTRQAGALNGSVRLLLEHLTLPGLERRISEIERQVKER